MKRRDRVSENALERKLEWMKEAKDLYYKGLERRDQISGKIVYSINFLTIIFTAHLVILSKVSTFLESNSSNQIPCIFRTFEVFGGALTVSALYFWFKTYFKSEYSILPAADLVKRIKDNNDDENNIDEDNYEMFIALLIPCIEDNEQINEKREKNQLKMNVCISGSLALLMASYLAWEFCL